MTTPIRPLIYQKKNEKNPSNKSARQNTSRGLKNRSATIPRPDKTHKGGEPAGSWVGQHWGGWWQQHGGGGG